MDRGYEDGTVNGTRALGGVFVGAAVGLIAANVGMPTWQVVVVVFLIGLGLPALATGRWSLW